ncbi:MAG: ribose 5-phosphate isomerase B [Proteobacteria bacterium]|nr:ribose 5-phosphate isomerase B [Pseudomonadota bacterium]
MQLVVAADHGGFTLKNQLVHQLRQEGHEVTDFGVDEGGSVDYPDYARQVALAVACDDSLKGILVCGTGQGMAMTANRIRHVRAAVVSDTFSARMAMAHNNANVLCLGERVVGFGLAWECVQVWLTTDFEGGRHERRVSKIEVSCC